MVNYICKRCDQIFEHKTTYVNHINRKRKCIINKSNSKSSKQKSWHQCNICNKSYKRKDSLIRHKKSKLHQLNIKNIKIDLNFKNNLKNNITNITGDKNIIKNTIVDKPTINCYICPFSTEGVAKLSTQDKITLFSSKENPIVMIVTKTNLNPSIPEFHNVGYRDLNSRYGIIFNGNTWEKKDIQSIMNELLNSKRKDLLEIHEEISKYLSIEDNKNINDVLIDIENTVMPKIDHHIKSKKKLVANLKTHFYNNRNLITKSIKKSGKPISSDLKTNCHQKNILRDGLTIEDLDKILKKKAKKLEPKKDIALYIINLIKYRFNQDEYYRINYILDNISKEYAVDAMIKLLCMFYVYKINIDINKLNEKIELSREENNIAKKILNKIDLFLD